jgi:hypothetical protein
MPGERGKGRFILITRYKFLWTVGPDLTSRAGPIHQNPTFPSDLRCGLCGIEKDSEVRHKGFRSKVPASVPMTASTVLSIWELSIVQLDTSSFGGHGKLSASPQAELHYRSSALPVSKQTHYRLTKQSFEIRIT